MLESTVPEEHAAPDERAAAAGGPQLDDVNLIAQTERLAERLLRDATSQRGRRERMQGQRISRLLDDPAGLAFILAVTDQVLRIRDPRRAAQRFGRLIAGDPLPQFLGPLDRLLLRVGALAAARFPRLVMPLVAARVRAELAGFVIPAEPRPFARHVARRRHEAVQLNINLLGEAVVGDDEADHRLEAVLDLLRRPDVNYVSVKVSSICAQLNIVAFDTEVDRVAARLRRLYDEALRHQPHKFVNLDMEEYADLNLTVEVFRSVLSEPRYTNLSAGIVLQAYIPDSLQALEELVAWTRERHRSNASAIKVRIVKGANLAMESVEAELAGWSPAPFATKAEVDANYKRMLDVALDPTNRGALRVGVASHNLFEVAWALSVSEARGLRDMVEMEMLEGMAPSIAKAVQHEAGGLLLYVPIARRADSESAMAYLVRRFDENTGPENFLRHQFSLRPATPTWSSEQSRFRAAVADRHNAVAGSRRRQDRGRGKEAPQPEVLGATEPFANEPDTDMALRLNRVWLSKQLLPLSDLGIEVVPAMVAATLRADLPLADGIDPGVPDVVAYQWAQSTEAVVDEAVAAALPAGAQWRHRRPQGRADALRAVADALVADRGRLIGVMARDGGKTVGEADPEVSEAVDFARYYADQAEELGETHSDGAQFTAWGTVVVVPPWNFPLAIPAGGIFAALAAGNAVILKPAPETIATAWALAQSCWRAGIPSDVLQFVPCADGDASRRLVTHPDVAAVILTGAWQTARMFLGWRPSMRLHAETSGKNAIVVTATADLDEAVADLVRSAFGHAGQKCSAASLGIIEASVYDDGRFLRQLADAVRTLRPGPGWDLRTTVGPMIRPPEGPLHDALHRLGPGESWLVEPHQVGANPQLWAPGVKLGVQPGSPFHLTECFGPVLGLMRASDLAEAIAWQNQPPYGLTAGLQSLDPDEIAQWRNAVQAGNLYVNRHITGAVVRRQPFGGWKRSVVGPGAKAGGPNYVAGLGSWQAEFTGSPEAFGVAVSRAWRHEMSPSDLSALAPEANVLRYVALRSVLLRVGADVATSDVERAVAAGRALGVEVHLSSPVARPGLKPLTIEADGRLAERVGSLRADKLRLVGKASDELRLAAYDAGLWLDQSEIVAHPRIEALRWVREQALSETEHRHGNLTPRRPGSLAALRFS